MKIGITGATGQLGRLVVEDLKEKVAVENLVALVRNPDKAAELGVQGRTFDYAKPETLQGSLDGIDTLLLISSNEIGQRENQHKNVIAAAKAAGVKRLVYTSLLRADSSTLSLAPEHLATEIALKASGITYTILRNGWYTENYTGSLAGAVASGVLLGSAGEGKISSAPRADYAQAAAIVLTSEGHENKTYELAGDDSYTLADLANQATALSGKTIVYKNLPEQKYAEALVQLGLPEAIAGAIASWDFSASKNDLFDDSKVLSSILGRATTPLADTVRETLK